jgi:hypothetical protein
MMLTRHSASHLIVKSLCCTLLLAGCATQDNDLGRDSEADGGTDAKASDLRVVTCEQDGKTYQVGESVALSACATCVCQQDGTLGLCTGLCASDAATPADTVVTCTQNGNTYQVGETVVLSACATCVCQKDGTIGLCTGACPPDAASKNDVAVTCTQDGNTYQVGESIRYSSCSSCVCQQDGTIGMCTGDCPPDAGTADVAGTCTLDGKSYPVGARVGSGCVSCACLADGTWGQCTGACPPDAGQPDTAKKDAAPDVAAAEAPPANYTCRDDSDCCIVVDTCINHAYLYSIAPGATGRPTLPPSGVCNRCVPPAVQVRCELGQCVGTELSDGADLAGQLRQNHCGLIGLPDAGARLYTPAYAGAQPTSWGC